MSQEQVLAVVGAFALLFLVGGLVQALTPPPRRRRRRVRRRVSRVPSRRRPGEGPGAEVGASAGAAAPSRRPAPVFTPRARPAAPATPPASAPAGGPAPTVSVPPKLAEETPPAFTPGTRAPEGPVTTAQVLRERAESTRAAPRAREAELPVEQCVRLYEAQQYQQVIAVAEPELQRALSEGATTAPPAEQVAKLWGVLALSRQSLGDEEGALSAFQEAIHAAPEDARPTYQRQMAALAVGVSRRLLAPADQVAEGAGEEQIRRLRQAVTWLRHGLEEAPDDAELKSALERARHGLWAACNQTAAALIQRQEFHRARRVIREALGDAEFPVDRREHFSDLLSATFTGEIGQLTASAIRTLEDGRDREALGFLERAEGILSGVPDDALTSKRREDANRRLWWGYTKLGVRRVEAGEYEDALEPLFHALKIGGIDSERQQETREALVGALEGVTNARGAAISQLAKDGNRGAAVAEMERLKALMRESLERGLSQQELSLALTKARRVMEALEKISS